MKLSVLLFAAGLLLVHAREMRKAIAVFETGTVTGIIKFIELPPRGIYIKVIVRLHGLTPGLHGVHVHEYGDLSQGCASTGAHYNPGMKLHGGSRGRDRHLGDIGNIGVGSNGLAIQKKILKLSPFRLLRFIGRGVVVHADKDDLGRGGTNASLANGNSGARVACAVIRFL